MERTKGQLRTRLADSLCGHHADSLAFLHEFTCSQVAAIALGANAVLGFAGEHGTDLHGVDIGGDDSLGLRFTNLLAGSDDKLACLGIINVVNTHTTQDTIVQRLVHGVAVLDLGSGQTTERTAVVLGDDHVVADVHQTAGQVTCVGGLQGGIGQTLTCTVRTDEVLEHRHTLLEVGKNRVLDERVTVGGTGFLRLGHKTTDTRQLLDLSLRTTGTRFHHHVHSVEALVGLGHLFHEDVGQVFVDLTPYADDAVVAVVVGDLTHVVHLGDVLHLGVTLSNHLVFLGRDDDIVERKAQAAFEGHGVTQVLDVVQEDSGTSHTACLDDAADDITQRTFLEDDIYVTHLFGDVFVDHQTTRSRLDEFAVHADLDAGVDVHFAFGESHSGLFG